MQSDTPTPASKKALWIGHIMSALPVLMLLMSAVMKFVKPRPVVEGFAHLGFPESLARPFGCRLCRKCFAGPGCTMQKYH